MKRKLVKRNKNRKAYYLGRYFFNKYLKVAIEEMDLYLSTDKTEEDPSRAESIGDVTFTPIVCSSTGKILMYRMELEKGL